MRDDNNDDNDDNDNDAADYDGNRCKLNPDKLRNALDAAVGAITTEAQVNLKKRIVCFIQKIFTFFFRK